MTFTFVAVNIFIKKFEFSRIECDACLTVPTFPSPSLQPWLFPFTEVVAVKNKTVAPQKSHVKLNQAVI